jgi:uncharacterized protein DUF6232
MSKRTYYSRPDAVVTDVLFTWCPATAKTKTFVVRDLRNVGMARAGSDGQKYVPALFACAMLLAGASLALLDAPTSYALSVLAVVVPGSITAAWRTHTRRWELHATYRGAEVIIYAATDARIFNQVSRALRRSMENARPPSNGLDLAAA